MQISKQFLQTWKRGDGGGIVYILPSLSVDVWTSKEQKQKNIDIEFRWIIWSGAIEFTWG